MTIFNTLELAESQDALKAQYDTLEALAIIHGGEGADDAIVDQWKAKDYKEALRIKRKKLSIPDSTPVALASSATIAAIPPQKSNNDSAENKIAANESWFKRKTSEFLTGLRQTRNYYFYLAWFTSIRLFLVRTNRVLDDYHHSIFAKMPSIPFAGHFVRLTPLFGLSYGLEFLIDSMVILKHMFRPDRHEAKLPWYVRAKNAFLKDDRMYRMINAAFWFSTNLALLIITGGGSALANVLPFVFDVAHDYYRERRELREHRAFLQKVEAQIIDTEEKLHTHYRDLFKIYQDHIKKKHALEIALKQMDDQAKKQATETELNQTRQALKIFPYQPEHPPAFYALIKKHIALEEISKQAQIKINTVKYNRRYIVNVGVTILAGMTLIFMPHLFLFVAATAMITCGAQSAQRSTAQKILLGLGAMAFIAACIFPPALFATTSVIILGAALTAFGGSYVGGFGRRIALSSMGQAVKNVGQSIANLLFTRVYPKIKKLDVYDNIPMVVLRQPEPQPPIEAKKVDAIERPLSPPAKAIVSDPAPLESPIKNDISPSSARAKGSLKITRVASTANIIQQQAPGSPVSPLKPRSPTPPSNAKAQNEIKKIPSRASFQEQTGQGMKRVPSKPLLLDIDKIVDTTRDHPHTHTQARRQNAMYYSREKWPSSVPETPMPAAEDHQSYARSRLFARRYNLPTPAAIDFQNERSPFGAPSFTAIEVS